MAAVWRYISKNDSHVSDLLALPAAVVEGKIAGRYTMAARISPDTLIIQCVRKRGILAGNEVAVDIEEAQKRDIDIALQPKAGRASLRPAGTVSLEELMLRSSDAFIAGPRNDDDVAVIIYTSGTTGLPKGVMLTERNFEAECSVMDQIVPIDPADRFASLVPYFHVFGLADGLVLALFRRNAAVLIPQYTPRRFLNTAVEERVTIVVGIPSQYLHLLTAGKRRKLEQRPRFHYCFSGAAALALDTMKEFQEVFGLTIAEGFGMTETTSAVSVNPPEKIKPGSIGIPCPGVAMKVVDEKNREVRHGERGEILIRGEVVTPGYYNLPEESKSAFVDGWLRTGDIGYCDEDGYFFITDRKKDLIIKGGYNISPREIEDYLCTLESIREAAVIGYTKSGGREEIRAFCVRSEGRSATAEHILHECRRNLAAYKTPDEIVFLDELPRSATGKVLKKELKEGYADMRLLDRDGL